MKSIIGWSTSLTATHTVRTTDENYLRCLQLQPALSKVLVPSYVVNTGDLKPITPGNHMMILLMTLTSSSQLSTPTVGSLNWLTRVNNLRVNPTKYAEIVFMDKKRKRPVQLPQPMPNVARVSVIKILWITFTNHLSVAEHVQTVINSSAQTLCIENSARTCHGRRSASDGFSS